VNNGKGQSGGINFHGSVGRVGDVFIGDKITYIINPIGKTIEAETPPGPNINVDQKRRFSISWPKDSDWIPSTRMGAYQLSQLGLTGSPRVVSALFGLVKREIQATFGVFKIQRPAGTCVGWVIVDTFIKFSKFSSFIKDEDTVKYYAVRYMNNMRNLGDEIIWQNINSDGAKIVSRDRAGAPPIVSVIIIGKYYCYQIGSTTYHPDAVYDKRREETNAILNSFTLLS
jgi:hypothetical protein